MSETEEYRITLHQFVGAMQLLPRHKGTCDLREQLTASKMNARQAASWANKTNGRQTKVGMIRMIVLKQIAKTVSLYA